MRDRLKESWVRRAALLLLLGALAYLALKSAFNSGPESDFRFLWLAGDFWGRGIDPYSAMYTAEGHRLFPRGNEIAYWLYPPQWWALCRMLAALPVAPALLVWRIGSALMLMAAGWALLGGLSRAGLGLPRTGEWLTLALLPLMEATPQTLTMGQTAILVFAGYALVGRALLAKSNTAMVAGLVLLCLKPQFGAAAVLPLLLIPGWWAAIAVASAISLVGALPQLAAHGLSPTITGFLGNLARHGELAPNQPDKLTGLTQILIRTVGLHLPTGLAVALAALAGGGAILLIRGTADATRVAAATGLALVAAALFLLPLHSYDFIALAPAAALVWPFGFWARGLVWAGILVALHPAGILARFGDRGPLDIAALTLAAVLVLAGAIVALATLRRARNA